MNSSIKIKAEIRKEGIRMNGEKKERVRLWTLFKTCFMISACTFGGGMVIIFLFVQKNKGTEKCKRLLWNRWKKCAIM